MTMIKWLKYLLTGILVSLFYFPVVIAVFPVAISKNILAVFGLVIVLGVLLRKQEFVLPMEFLMLLLLSGVVSIIALFASNYNQTPDNTYAMYFRSVCIWLSAAFFVCYCIWRVHDRLDIPLIVNYLAAVCVFQCFIAIAIWFVPAVQAFVDANFLQGQTFFQNTGRLYGIGAFLDVGGSRFAAVLVAIAFLMEQDDEKRGNTSRFWLVLAFCIITVLGNIIARTTIVGTIIGLFYILLMEIRTLISASKGDNVKGKSSAISWVFVLGFSIPLLIFLYQISAPFQELMRFGFEGFFSLVEEGKWNVSSNTALESMIVWPEEFRTWVIGDGYFENQRNDVNYIGDATTEGFYMGTDIGYLRFIFYFGVIGLLAISATIIYTGVISMNAFKDYSLMFAMATFANFVVWLKVATDLFPFLGFFAAAAFFISDLEFIKPRKKNE